MSMFVELTVLIATLLGASLGAWCIYWVKARPATRLAWWARRLFVATLMSMGGTALFAALAHADGLSPLGLLAGLLIVGMLWESPAPALQDEI